MPAMRHEIAFGGRVGHVPERFRQIVKEFPAVGFVAPFGGRPLEVLLLTRVFGLDGPDGLEC